MTLQELQKIAIDGEKLSISPDALKQIDVSFSFLNEFASDKIIYGINTGFGPMAQFKIPQDQLNQLQYNLIRSHSSGLGKPLSKQDARAVMLARINNFLQGNSGVSAPVILKLQEFLNKDITPEIFEHGSVGASGDLVQLAHLALNLIGEGYVYINGVRTPTKEAFEQLNVTPLQIQLRDGLGLMNGTSCMTGIGAVNLILSQKLLNWGVLTSTILNEIIEAYDDSFSQELNTVKRHKGQAWVAQEMRSILSDSNLIQSREELFKNDLDALPSEIKKKVQEYYSIRCVPQILGPVKDTLDFAQQVIEDELNSTNDNPVVRPAEENVFHGGNFHGDYISLEMDKVKIVVTKMTMLAERQLNFLLNHKINDQFPPFLNKATLGLNFGLQGMQFTATSTTAESQMLSNPMYVHSIPNNNDNQDIVSMGTNSANIARKVIENGYQVMAIHAIAIAQAIDFLNDDQKERLSSKTKAFYQDIRAILPTIVEDAPSFEKVKEVIDHLRK